MDKIFKRIRDKNSVASFNLYHTSKNLKVIDYKPYYKTYTYSVCVNAKYANYIDIFYVCIKTHYIYLILQII